MADLSALLDDLAAEGADLDALVAALPSWDVPTPAEGWTIAHQIGHLAWTDEVALLAARYPEGFQEVLEEAAADPEGFVDAAAAAGPLVDSRELLQRWRDGRAALVEALRAAPEGVKLPWFGPPMSVASMATARIMETWAHGQDVADALNVQRQGTDRLRHVAHLGVRTRDFAFGLHGLPAPGEAFFVDLVSPSGERWTFGPPDAEQRVSGPALDFCLLVTQRRNRSELALVADGTDADRWLDIAQAFAGPPGKGRQAG